MSENDRSYFLQRTAAEAARAERSAHPAAAAVHRRLADAYRERVDAERRLTGA